MWKNRKELIEEIQAGKWDGKFLSIFPTSYEYEEVTEENPYAYFLEKYIKDKYTDYFPLYRIAHIINVSNSTFKIL